MPQPLSIVKMNQRGASGTIIGKACLAAGAGTKVGQGHHSKKQGIDVFCGRL